MKDDSTGKPRNQVHIVSAGKGMNETFKTALREFNIGSIVVFREEASKGKTAKETEEAIDRATSEMRRVAGEIGISFSVKKVKQNNMNDVRDKVLMLTQEFPDGEFYFNLTHGRKILPLFLLTMAVWLDGSPYYIDLEQQVTRISIPRMHGAEIAANPNYMVILRALFENKNGDSNTMRYRDLYSEVSKRFIQNKNAGAGRPGKLHMGTFSKWIRRLIESELIDQKFEDGSYKKKTLGITSDGEFTYKFMQAGMPGVAVPSSERDIA